MTGYNITRSAEELLDKYESDSPSFSIHLYPEYWTLNNGPKFLYNNPVAVSPDWLGASPPLNMHPSFLVLVG